MATTDVTFSKTTPTAPTNTTNVEWQTDGLTSPHLSANVPNMTASQGGLTPTPPNDAGKYLDGTAVFSYPIGGPISGTIDLGAIPIGQADGSVVWADPTVQGVYADGASIASPGSPGTLSTIQPVLVAGKNASGNMTSIPITTNGVKIDGSAVTQPVSASSLPLPANAAQETGGNLATIASAAAVPSAGTAPSKGLVRLSIANNTPPSATNGQSIAAQSDLQGNQRINPTGSQGSFQIKFSSGTGAALPSFTVTSGKKWILFAGAILGNTTTGNGTLFMTVADSGGDILYKLTGPSYPTSNVNRTCYGPSLPLSTSFTAANATAPMPQLFLPAGAVISVTAGGSFGAGDTVTLTLNIQELPD